MTREREKNCNFISVNKKQGRCNDLSFEANYNPVELFAYSILITSGQSREYFPRFPISFKVQPTCETFSLAVASPERSSLPPPSISIRTLEPGVRCVTIRSPPQPSPSRGGSCIRVERQMEREKNQIRRANFPRSLPRRASWTRPTSSTPP